ncbi:MAG: PPOX class F420-dependent oxidoreductase [Actinomycetota bacterium]|jgi:PPOX class probable F420-dependent enzyme|nr:PPOX class F420-dependent oxidoreductase [Actinomycetota bacterium]
MSDQLTKSAKALLQRPVIANVATVSKSGAPQLSPVWIDIDGDDIVFNTADGRQKPRNLRENPAVAVSVVDPDDPYRVIIVRGRVKEITEEGADEHIDFLASKYLGKASYPFRQEGERRLKVRVGTDRIVAQPEDPS